MFYPIETLEYWEDDIESGYTYRMEFECYWRFVTAVAYDTAYTLSVQMGRADLKETLEKMKMQNVSNAKVAQCEIDELIDRFYPEFKRAMEAQFFDEAQSDSHNRANIDQLLCTLVPPTEPGTENKVVTVRSVLAERSIGQTPGSGDYMWNILLFLQYIREMAPRHVLMNYLEEAAFTVAVSRNLRNTAYHALTPAEKKEFANLREWRRSRHDIFFDNSGEKRCQRDMVVPIASVGNQFRCRRGNGSQREKDVELSKSVLLRDDWKTDEEYLNNGFYISLFVESREVFVRLNPFLSLDHFEGKFKTAQFGYLMRQTEAKTYEYRKIPDNESLDNYDYERIRGRYFYYGVSVALSDNSKFQRINQKCEIYLSKYCNFKELCGLTRLSGGFVDRFVYFPVLEKRSTETLNKLLQKRSGVEFVFLEGHGGLGKTHQVFHLLREHFRPNFVPKRDEVFFEKIIFLSAKKEYYPTDGSVYIQGRNESSDISSYDELINLMVKLILPQDPGRNREEMLCRDSKAVFLIVDDLDTLSDEDQRKVSDFLADYCGECHRVLVTSRIYARQLSTHTQAQIRLEPLDNDRAVQFLLAYNSRLYQGNTAVRGQILKLRDRLNEFTRGVPLNLVLLWVLLKSGSSINEEFSEQILFSTQECTRFMFTHILDALPNNAKAIFSVMSQFSSAICMEHMDKNILHLLLPALDDFDNALNDLVDTYVINEIGEDNRVSIRSEILYQSDEGKDVLLDSYTNKLLKDIRQNSGKWGNAVLSHSSFLTQMLDYAKERKARGDEDERRWICNLALLVLRLWNNDDGIPQKQKKIWQNLRRPSELDELEASCQELEICLGDEINADTPCWSRISGKLDNALRRLDNTIDEEDILEDIFKQYERIIACCTEISMSSNEIIFSEFYANEYSNKVFNQLKNFYENHLNNGITDYLSSETQEIIEMMIL